MRKKVAVFAGLFCALTIGAAYGQECLHGTKESAEQTARRREALTATRNINNIEANQAGAAKGVYLRYAELAGSPYASKMRESTSDIEKRISLNPGSDILPNWSLTLDVNPKGYWFMIRDKADPCGFAYISNQSGVIFHAEPIR